jgi:hypothetical protein
MRKWAFGWLTVLFAASAVMNAGGAFAASQFLGGNGHYVFNIVSPDDSLKESYNKWRTVSMDEDGKVSELLVGGDLSAPLAWAIASDFLFQFCSPDAELEFYTIFVPADIVTLTGKVPAVDEPAPEPVTATATVTVTEPELTWGIYWNNLSGLQPNKNLKISLTLKDATSTEDGNANALVKIFAGETDIPLENLELQGDARLTIPPDLEVRKFVVGGNSTVDFSEFKDETEFVGFWGGLGGELEVGRIDAELGATFIVPDGFDTEDLVIFLALFFGDEVPEIKAETKNGLTKWSAEEIQALVHPKSSSGCDAGFGLGGVFLLLLAGAVLTGRGKRG